MFFINGSMVRMGVHSICPWCSFLMGFLYISMVCSYFSTVFIEFVLGVHRCFQCFYLCFHCLSILHEFVAMIFVDFHVFNGLEPINKYIIYIYICMYVCMSVYRGRERQRERE